MFAVVSRISSLGKHKCLPLPYKVPMIKQSLTLPNFTLGEINEFIGLTSRVWGRGSLQECG